MFQRWFLPGFLFQSVLIGGGYATGRELVEYFLSYGALGGFLGLLLATVILSVVSTVFFEFARITRSLNYMDFFQHLLGKGWFLYEIGYLLLGILVLSVVGAASGEIVNSSFGFPKIAGTFTLCMLTVFMVFRGTGFIERALAGWSFLLYTVYVVFITLFLIEKGGLLGENLATPPKSAEWALGSLEYAGYSIVVLPIIIFVSAHFERRKDSIIAGLLCGPIALAPALFFYLAMAADYQAVQAEAVPSEYMIRQLGIGWLSIVFYITIFGTFVETGTAFIHAFNERIAEAARQRGLTFRGGYRALVAVVCLLISVVIAEKFGLVAIIGQGYGTLTWFFILIFLLPLMTLGVVKIIRNDQ